MFSSTNKRIYNPSIKICVKSELRTCRFYCTDHCLSLDPAKDHNGTTINGHKPYAICLKCSSLTSNTAIGFVCCALYCRIVFYCYYYYYFIICLRFSTRLRFLRVGDVLKAVLSLFLFCLKKWARSGRVAVKKNEWNGPSPLRGAPDS